MNYTVIDLIKDSNSINLIDNFKKFIKSNCKEDLLYENYANLKLEDFISLTAVLEDKEIVALSGVQFNIKKWGLHTVRMSTRFWMHPKYRINSLSKFDPASRFYFNSQLMIPAQLEFLKNYNAKYAIITREGNYRRSYQKFIKLVNYHNKTNFIVLDGLYNVCEPMEEVPESCQQIIAYYSLDGSDFLIELEKLQQEKKLYPISR